MLEELEIRHNEECIKQWEAMGSQVMLNLCQATKLT